MGKSPTEIALEEEEANHASEFSVWAQCAMEEAQELVREKNENNIRFLEKTAHLPLLKIDCTYDKRMKNKSFRIPKGASLEVDTDCRKVRVCKPQVHSSEIEVILQGVDAKECWPGDYEYFFMYWDMKYRNDEGLSLSECVTQYGIGGCKDIETEIYSKVVYMSQSRDINYAFVFAAGLEVTKDKFHFFKWEVHQWGEPTIVYRSCIPREIKDVIMARQLMNLQLPEECDTIDWWKIK
tara:strand:- start:1136 stop:1849 length:714 start_codon:yes stop_codon:yes gene_type:complete